jgi:hypothetical protein
MAITCIQTITDVQNLLHTIDKKTISHKIFKQNELSASKVEKKLLKPVDLLCQEIFRTLNDMERNGFVTIVQICKKIILSPAYPFLWSKRWTYCCITGEKINNCIHIESYDLHGKFYPPFLALWITSHISELETTRNSKGSSKTGEQWNSTYLLAIQAVDRFFTQILEQKKTQLEVFKNS